MPQNQMIPPPPPGFVPVGSDTNANSIPDPPAGFVPVSPVSPVSPSNPLGEGFMGKVVGGMLGGADKHSQIQQELDVANELNPDNATGVGGVATGFGKGVLESMEGVAHGAGSLVGKVVGVPDAGDKVVAKMFGGAPNTEATNGSQDIGKAAESIAEFAAGDEALSGLNMATKIADLAEKYPKVAKTLELARKHPVIAKMITEGLKSAAVGATQGTVKGAAHGDPLREAIGGGVGGAVGGALGSRLESAIAGEPSQRILKILGVGGLTPEEALTKAGRPSTKEGERFADSLEKAIPLIKEFPKGQIKSVGDFEDMLHDRANTLWNETIKPQVDRNANEVIDGDPIALNIRKGVSEGMNDLFPEQTAPVEAMAQKFANSKLSLDKANNYLKTINAELKDFYKLSPDARYASGITNGRLSALENAADGLREGIYSKLEEMGEQNPRDLRQQYGALKDLERVFGKRATVADRQAPLNLTQVLGGMEAAGALLSGHPLAAIAGAYPWAVKARGSSDSLIRQAIAASQPGSGAVRRAVGGAVGKAVSSATTQGGRLYFRASDNTIHSVPNTPDAINQSLSVDPKLIFITPPPQQ